MRKLLFSTRRIVRGFSYSRKGMSYVFKNEIAFRQDVFVFLIGMILSFFLPVTAIARAIMIFSLFFILLMEMVNTAIEVIIDRISRERHPLSGHAKDIGSALVLVSFINAIIVWITIILN